MLDVLQVDAGGLGNRQRLGGSGVFANPPPQAHGATHAGNGHGAVDAGAAATPGDGMGEGIAPFVGPFGQRHQKIDVDITNNREHIYP